MATDHEAAVEIREAIVAVAEQFEDLIAVVDRVDALHATAMRIGDAPELLVRQHHAASRAERGPAYATLCAEERPR